MSWFVPNGDCNCSQCDFSAGFHYNDPFSGLDLDCRLIFIVYGAFVGCESVAIEDATISVEITGPDGAEGPVVTLPSGTWSNGALFWEKWKPLAGATYNATVTLTCGSEVVTKEYEFTIPTPANTSCICCTERTPDYLTVSGFTNQQSVLNGTYALTTGGIVYRDPSTNLEQAYCAYQPASQPADPGDPPDPCNSGNSALLYYCTASDFREFFYYPGPATVYLWTPNAFSIAAGYTKIRVQLTYAHYVWRSWYRTTPVCVRTGIFGCAYDFELWEFEIDCNTGIATQIGYYKRIQGGSAGSWAEDLLSTDTPEVGVYLEP